MKLAVLGGTGRQGRGLAMRLALQGHTVWVGSRTPEKAERAVETMRARLPREVALQPADNASAAQAAEVVFLTVPHPHEYDTVAALRERLLGKILVDVSVPLTRLKPPQVTLPPEGSAAEGVQKIVGSGVPVVAAFKATSAVALARIEAPLEVDELICGDDAAAKETVIALVRELGARAFDAGPLYHARALELLTGMLIEVGQRYGCPDLGIRLSGSVGRSG